MGTSTQHYLARKAFDASYRIASFCNWCGSRIIDRLVHHGDGNPDNNQPDNLWALCGRACHWEVHEQRLGQPIRSMGGLTTAAGGGGLKKLHSDGFFTSEFQSTAGKAGVGECKARGARIANAKKVQCPDCDRVMNPGSLGMHKRVHAKEGA